MKILAVARSGPWGAAALVADGKVLACVEAPLAEGQGPVPRDAVRECLAAARLDADEVERIVLCGALRETPRFDPSPAAAAHVIAKATARIRRGLAEAEPALGRCPLRARAPLEALAAATFFASPFPAAPLILFAGEDRRAAVHVWQGLQGRLRAAYHLPPPHSPARLLEVFGHYLGLTPGRFAYDLAYLGAYGAPRHAQALLAHCVDLRPDGSFALKAELGRADLAAPRAAERLRRSGALPRPGRCDGEAAHLARSVVAVLRYLLGHLAIHLRRRMGAEALCLGGDFAWHLARQRLLPEDGLFRQAWVHPQRGPAALALGAALAEWHAGGAGREPMRPTVSWSAATLPFLGAAHSDLSVEGFLSENGIPADTMPAERIPWRTAELVRHRQRVGWFHGREEVGTGPAGHRHRLSMVGRAELEGLNDPRQAGRIIDPVTLAVLADQAERYFEPEPAPPFRSAPLAGPWLCYWRGAPAPPAPSRGVPAATRPPLSGRGPVAVLRVTAQHHPALFRLLEALQQQTGVPLLRAEPLADADRQGRPARSPAEAYALLRAGALDALVIGRSVVQQTEALPELPAPPVSAPLRLRRLATRYASRWLAPMFALPRRRASRWLAPMFALPRRRARAAIAWGAIAWGAIAWAAGLGPSAIRRMAAAWPLQRDRASYWRPARGAAEFGLTPLTLPSPVPPPPSEPAQPSPAPAPPGTGRGDQG